MTDRLLGSCWTASDSSALSSADVMGAVMITGFGFRLAALGVALAVFSPPCLACLFPDDMWCSSRQPHRLPGWPVENVGTVVSAPVVADIDGDGANEVVFTSRNGNLYVLEADGSLADGWPYEMMVGSDWPPSLTDIDGDGTLEIFQPVGSSVVGLRHDGTLLPGWPQSGAGFSSLSIGDVDGDGREEIVAAGESLYVWDSSGNLMPGWPFAFPPGGATISLGDVDGDGVLEIAAAFSNTHGSTLHVFNGNGSSLNHFPVMFSRGLYSVPLADVENDGRLELWAHTFSGTSILDWSGAPLDGFPIYPPVGNAPPAIGDIGSDGRLEMMWSTRENCVAYRDDGTTMPGWPHELVGGDSEATLGDVDGDGVVDVIIGWKSGFAVLRADGNDGFWCWLGSGQLSTITITDLDQDGGVDLVFSGRDRSIQALGLRTPYSPVAMEWPTQGHDVRHTSRYEPPPRLAAHAGFDREVLCKTLGGEVITLDGSHSADKDSTPGTNDDIVSFEWFNRFGSPSETFLGSGETLDVALGLGGHEMTLRVTDSTGNQDTDSVRISIVDTEAPEILVSHSVLWPPNHRMVSMTAEVQDCNASSFTLVSVESNEPDDAPGLGDGKTTGDIQGVMPGTADLAFELRAERDGAGQGRTYSLIYETEDVLGNAAARTVAVLVPHDLGGLTEPLLLTASGTPLGTLVAWSQVTGASSYDVVRGELGSIKDLNGVYHLGSLDCIAATTTQTSTAGQEDAAQPALGESFFYLAAYDDGSWSGYGTESAAKDRFIPPGQDGCR